MRDALTRLSHASQKQNAWTFTGQPQRSLTSSVSGNARTASLTDGIDRDITDVLGLLGPLADEDQFAGGKAVYDKALAYITAAQGVLEGNITPAQAGKQVAMIAPVAAPAPVTVVPQTPPAQNLGGSAPPPTGQSAGPSSGAYLSPGTAEWQNEVQNYLAWGFRNGG